MLTGQGPLQPTHCGAGPGLFGPWEGRRALCLFLIYPRVRENSTRPQPHFFGCNIPMQEHKWPPPHTPLPSLVTALLGLSCRELLPALLLRHLGWICASIELALNLTEIRRGSDFAVTSGAMGSLDFFTAHSQSLPRLCADSGPCLTPPLASPLCVPTQLSSQGVSGAMADPGVNPRLRQVNVA